MKALIVDTLNCAAESQNFWSEPGVLWRVASRDIPNREAGPTGVLEWSEESKRSIEQLNSAQRKRHEQWCRGHILPMAQVPVSVQFAPSTSPNNTRVLMSREVPASEVIKTQVPVTAEFQLGERMSTAYSLAQMVREMHATIMAKPLMNKIVGDMPLDLKEAAAYLGVHYDTMYKWAVEEHLVGWYDLSAKGAKKAKPRFYKRDLDIFVKTYRIEAV